MVLFKYPAADLSETDSNLSHAPGSPDLQKGSIPPLVSSLVSSNDYLFNQLPFWAFCC